MKAEAFLSAAKAAQQGESPQRVRYAGLIRCLGHPLYIAILEGESPFSMHLLAATTNPDDHRLSVVDVRYDTHSLHGFLGATNHAEGSLIAKDTSVFVPNKGEEVSPSIGRYILEGVSAFEELAQS